jgi:RND superfamily putative drug exporter
MSNEHVARPFIPRVIRGLSVPILLFWLALTAMVTIAVPPLEAVGREHSVSFDPSDAPSTQAIKRVGQVFREFDSDSFAVIVLERDKPLDDAAHHYYDNLVRQLKQDRTHVQHIDDFWGDPLTAAGVQSTDGEAVYVQVYLAGNQGSTLASESINAVRDIVAHTPRSPGVKAYVTGPEALIADQSEFGDKSMVKVTAVSVVVITIMLLIVYRSVISVLIQLVMVGIELGVARGLVAALGLTGAIGLTTFATALITSLAIAAGTDYGIFFIGRYQEARRAGEDHESAYYTTFRGVAPVVLGSGLTIAGAMYCLSFAQLPYFQTLGVPTALGMLIAVVAALTMGPATLDVAGRFGFFDPRRRRKVRRGWRKVGTAVARWPGPILVATCATVLVGLLALPGYKPNYDDRPYMPANTPDNVGYQAADRHFSPARMNPTLLLVEADHDMRNPESMLVLDKVAKDVFHIPGIAQLQGITRPLGTPIAHSSMPFQIGVQNAANMENIQYLKDRTADMLRMGDKLLTMIGTLQRMEDILRRLADATHHLVGDTKDLKSAADRVRDHLADFDDFFRPARNYFYWEKHCFDIPFCWALRSTFDALDGVDQISQKLETLITDLGNLDALMPQMVLLLPPMIDTMATMRTMLLTMHSTFSGLYGQMDAMGNNASAMGKAFDAAKTDDSFYLPPEAFENPEFKRGLTMFLSPDGKAARFIISHEGEPTSSEGISRVDPIRTAAHEAVKGTPLAAAKIYVAGTAAIYKDLAEGTKYDLMIAGIAAGTLIVITMLVLTRSLIAALVIVGTVALSLGTSFGLSVLLWQNILGIGVHWMVLAMSVIVLLAVGSDYNLLLVSRFKEELGAGLKTGIVRAMAGTGAVATSAGLVFAFTMGSMVVSDLLFIGQVGTTIGLGLLFDTLIVRTFMMPSVAVLLGRWFWWPQTVRSRPASNPRQSAPSPVLKGLPSLPN